MSSYDLNKEKVELLSQNKFFSHPFTNRVGLELYKYMTSNQYYSLFNSQIVNEEMNTVSKVFNYLKAIDDEVNKPLNEYTAQDLSRFIVLFRDGKIKARETRIKREGGELKVETVVSDKTRKPNNLSRYITEFKRFWRVYKEYAVNVLGERDLLKFEWGLNLKAPKIKREYEDYPYLTINDVVTLAENMTNIEYKNRVLVSVNFMGRKSEISALRYSDVEFRNNGSEMWIKLPQTKLNSSEKVPVEVFKFVKKHFEEYLRVNSFEADDLLFPSKEAAFAKNLRIVSEKLFKKRVAPKTLRKIGVCVAEQLGYDRSDVERIGGWSVNSPVLNHYFKRKGVSAKKANMVASKELDKDVYVELDKMKVKEQFKDGKIAKMESDMQEMRDMIHFLSGKLGEGMPNIKTSEEFVNTEKELEALHRAKRV